MYKSFPLSLCIWGIEMEELHLFLKLSIPERCDTNSLASFCLFEIYIEERNMKISLVSSLT